MKKISVVVPVYNVEKYIEKCILSLVNQTHKNLECIFVIDGSKDKSVDIVKKYQKKYPEMIFCYEKKNEGVSMARNYGLKKATGDYIAFLDSDDYVESNTYEKLYNSAIKNNSDLVICDLFYVYDEKKVKFKEKFEGEIIDVKNYSVNLYPVVWNKLYKKLIFDKIDGFKKNYIYEDVEFLYRMVPHLKKISLVRDYLINYVQRDGSITSKVDDKIMFYVENWNGLLEFYKKNNFYDKYRMEIEYSYVRYLRGTMVKQAIRTKDKVFINKIYKLSKDEIRRNIKNPLFLNKYFYKDIKGLILLTFNKIYIYLMLLK